MFRLKVGRPTHSGEFWDDKCI